MIYPKYNCIIISQVGSANQRETDHHRDTTHDKILVDPRSHATTETGLLSNSVWAWQGER